MNIDLNIYQTLAVATAVYYIGVLLRLKIPFLRRYCIPAPVIGGILFAILNDILYVNGIWTYRQDTVMQNVFMMLFFTSIGYTASISLIRKGEFLVRRYGLTSVAEEERLDPANTSDELEKLEKAAHGERKAIDEEKRAGQSINNYRFMNALAHLLIAMGLGTVISQIFISAGLVFPNYISSMLVAAIIRNISDYTHAYKIYQRESEVLGNLGLTIFLSCALMSLKLWQLSDLAIPMMVMLLSQVLFLALFAKFLIFRVMGRNYEAAVMAAGTCGFGLGATPNAIANMSVMVERFGPAPTAFFVIPLIGALIVDFVNSSIVTVLLNLLT